MARSAPAWSRLGCSSSAWEAPSCSQRWPQQVMGELGLRGLQGPTARVGDGDPRLEHCGAGEALPCRAQPSSARGTRARDTQLGAGQTQVRAVPGLPGSW